MRGLPPTKTSSKPRSNLLRTPRSAGPDDLHALRELLVGPEQVRLEQVERATTPESIGTVLPEAVAHASEKRGDELSTAIQKPVRTALRDIARREPNIFGEILAPVIGTAVRRAVKDAMAAISQRMNQLLEHGLSMQSLKWRLEAKRTGEPFAEVVLARTLLFRVEWVVLIDTETSLVLEQANLPEVTARSPDQIAAMLQAISAFVSEAFQPASPGADLQSLEVGDLTVWVERHTAIAVAAAIRGAPPRGYRDVLRQTLERVQTLHHASIATHRLDPTSFADTQPLLAECLQQQVRSMPNRVPWVLGVMGFAIMALVGALWFRAHAQDRRQEARDRHDAEMLAAYEHAVEAVPGIFVTSIERTGDTYRIEGLRDPRAEPIERIIERAGLEPVIAELAPYNSLDPRLEPPLQPKEETEAADPLLPANTAIVALETIQVPFETGDTAVDPNLPMLQRAAKLVNDAHDAATAAGASLCVEVIGHTDSTGATRVNEKLRRGRATAVADALVGAGVAPNVLHPHAAYSQSSRERVVTFRASLRPGSSLPGCPQ